MKKLLYLAASLMLLCVSAFGQYTWQTPTMSLVDNTANCATFNCLTSIAGPVAFAEVKTGVDAIYGLTSSHALYTYAVSTGWVLAPSALQTAGGNVIWHISVGSAGNVLAQTAVSSPNVYLLNSAGTAWTHLAAGECLDAEIGADGDLWCVGTDSGAWHYVSGAWVSTGGVIANLSVAWAGQVWAVGSNGHLWYWSGTAWAGNLAPGFNPSHSIDAIAAYGESTISVIDTAGGIHVSSNGAASWSTIQGTAAAISGGGPVTFVRDSAGTSYHVNRVVPALTVTGGGTFNCAGGCPEGAYHTLTSTAKFGGKGGLSGIYGASNTVSGVPTANLQTVATETGVICDPMFGSPNDPECQGTATGIASCTLMGTLVTFQESTGPILTAGIMETGANFTSGASSIPYVETTCPTQNYCTPATTPPLCNAGPAIVPYRAGQASPAALCRLHSPWLELIPFIEVSVSPFGTIYECSPVGEAIPLGAGAPPQVCRQDPTVIPLD